METKKKRRRAKAKVEKARSAAKRAKAPKDKKGLSIKIYNMKGKEVETFALDEKVFTGEVNKGALYQAMLMYNANRRHGNASTKTRSDVSGGGKKPFRQKGTGRARAGSTRSPLWRGGGIIFGPHKRDFHYSIPVKIKRLAFLSSLNSKIGEGKVIGIDALNIDEPKTKKFLAVVDALKLNGKSLFVLDNIDEKVRMASRNLEDVTVKNYKDFNTMDVLASDAVVMSKAALEKLPERVK